MVSFWNSLGEDVALRFHTEKSPQISIKVKVWLVQFQHPKIHISVKMKLYGRVTLEHRFKISLVTPIQSTMWIYSDRITK